MRKSVAVCRYSSRVARAAGLALSRHSVSGAAADHKEFFQTSDRCFACHNGLSTSTGEDISIGLSWRPTMMANSARDPYWQAGVRRETIDHPESKAAIEDECATCHMPMARYQSKYEGKDAEVFSRLALRLRRQNGPACSGRRFLFDVPSDHSRTSLGPEKAGLAVSSWTRQRTRASGRSTGLTRLKTAKTASCDRLPEDIVRRKASTFESPSCAPLAIR